MKAKSNIIRGILSVVLVILCGCNLAFSQINLIQDGGFEQGPMGGAWTEFSTNFGTPVCDMATCGAGGGTGPHSGTYWVWGGGISQTLEIASVEQTITIPADTSALLTFYLELMNCDDPIDYLDVYIDGDTVYHIDGGSSLCGVMGYTLQTVDVSAYADGNAHTITFYSSTFAPNGNVTNFFIDDVSLYTNSYNLIKGRLFADLNSNSIQDAGEPGLPNISVWETFSGNAAVTNNSGDYVLVVFDTGTFSVSPEPVTFFNQFPAAIPGFFNTFGNVDSGNNFMYQPVTAFNNLGIVLSPAGNFRSGFNATYHIDYYNSGTTVMSPVITFYPDSNLDYITSTVPTSLVTGDSIQWTPGSLNPFQTGQFNVTVHLDLGLPIGTLINSTVKIEPIVADTNPVNNIHNWEVLTTGSYDPNDILVSRSTLLTTEFPNPPFLYYTIRFQNTGNDTAFTVRVTNEIPLTLNSGSFELLATSHNAEVTYNAQTNVVQFLFNNILLPDSNVNEPASNGYITYRIKPVNNLVLGNTILNNAAIYFDFNPPVLTNDAVTTVVSPLGINEPLLRNRINMHPNPAQDEITVDLSKLIGNDIRLALLDMQGRKIQSLFEGNITDQNSVLRIDITKLSAGVYFMEASTGNQTENLKLIKR